MPASQTKDFFRGRLDQMINLRHPLAVLSTHMSWQEIEASLAGVIAHKVRAGRKVEDIDLFGPVVQVPGGGFRRARARGAESTGYSLRSRSSGVPVPPRQGKTLLLEPEAFRTTNGVRK